MKKLHIASLASLLIASFSASASVSAAQSDYDSSLANQRAAHHRVQKKQQRHQATHPTKARHHKKHASKAHHHRTPRHKHQG
jgi:hypothetical protein